MESVQEVLRTTYFENTLGQYLAFFGFIILGIIVGKIFYYISKTYLRRLAAKFQTKFEDYLIDIIEEPIVLALITAGFAVGALFLTLNEPAQKFFDNVRMILLTFTVAWFLVRLVEMLITVYVEPWTDKTESKLDDQILPILKKTGKVVIAVLAFIMILSNMGYDIMSIIAGLGIGGLALALASQDAVKNVIGGITIFWDKPFQIDDWIEVSGKSGSVHEVGIRSTRIKTLGGTTVVLPNSKVADSMLENFSHRPKMRRTVNIGLTYETTADQMEKAFDVITQSIQQVEGVDKDDIMIRFVDFGAFSLDLEIVYYILQMSEWKMIIHRVNMALKRNLDAAGIDMAFPTETHYVIQQKKL